MKYSFFLLAVLLLATGSCAPKKGLSGPEQRKRVNDYRNKKSEKESIAGFWQEYKRTQVRKRMAERSLGFTDTLKVVFREDSTSRFYDMYGRISAGKFMYKNGLYHLGNGQTFRTIEKLGDTLRLGNGSAFSYVRKVPGFYTKPIAKERVDIEGGLNNDVLDASFLRGKWKVYKKADETFTRQKIYLKSLEIKNPTDQGDYDVQVYYHNSEKVVKDIGTLSIVGSTVRLDLTKGSDEYYDILQAKDDELVLKRGDIIYYLKNLSR